MKTGLHNGLIPLRFGSAPGRFRADLPAGAAGAWCRLTVGLTSAEPWWAKLEVTDDDRGQVVREVFLGPRHSGDAGWRSTLVHLPSASRSLEIQLITATGTSVGVPWAKLVVLRRPSAALAILVHGWRLLPRALAGRAMGLPGRVRTMLGQAPGRGGEVPPYAVWIELYDRWGYAERAAMARHSPIAASIAVVVVGPDRSAQAVTLAHLNSQWLRPLRSACVARPADFVAGDEAWVLVLQAGERIPQHALACFAQAIQRWPESHGFYADADAVVGGVRGKPLLKPKPDPWLLSSGLLTAGSCLFRTSAVVAWRAAYNADEWRRSAALSAGAGNLKRIPFVLTHVPGPMPVFRNVGYRPGTAAPPLVSVVIPSAARSSHVLRCIRQIAAHTSYPHLEVLVAVSQAEPGPVQARVIAALERLPRVRVIGLDVKRFNYAAVNNIAVRRSSGEVVVLMNDDVLPVQPDWLERLVSYTLGPPGRAADIVGARLLYGNDTVQHGGVILGLANLCEHAFRLAPYDDFGPYGIARLDRQVSAVTGACMLLRRSLYETLGGLDESFAIALNDVDMCLRAGAAGAQIVLAAEVELYHYESLSLGRHYQSGRAALEVFEVSRLRQRWASVIADDPWYNPCASLIPGHEFQPGFPPRCSPLSWSRGEMP